MTYIAKPRVIHPRLEKNAVGLTRRDYEGKMSTLCAGCGHDSITAALIETFWSLDLVPHRIVKVSGIGCSAKTPTYFVNDAHGFNAVHGRMPSIVTGASAARRDLLYVGISGDGDSLSIGIGQMCHAIRRNVNMLYLIENNGVYGLTKGQFSASADVGSTSKRGEPNRQPPIDPVLLGLGVGASFVARGFSGDKDQLVPILQAALKHPGLALVDVVSPCVTFNDHEGSTKSYRYTREHYCRAVEADFVPPAEEITASIGEGDVTAVPMHDGSRVLFRRVDREYDPTDRERAFGYVREHQERGEVVTGLLFLDPGVEELHDTLATVERPLAELSFEELCPGGVALEELQEAWR